MGMRRGLLFAAGCLVLTGCGGGGSPDLTIAPTPTPTSPATNPKPTLTGLTASQSLINDAAVISGLVAVPFGSTTNISSVPTSLTVQYDASTNGYTITGPTAAQTFLPSDISSSSTANTTAYTKSSGGTTDTLTLNTVPLVTGENYVGLGYWERDAVNNSQDTASYNTFTYGFPTAATAVPRTGSAVYNTLMFGLLASTMGNQPLAASTGTGSLNVDFISGLFGLTMNATEIDVASKVATNSNAVFEANGQLSSTDGSLTGAAGYMTRVGATTGSSTTVYLSGPLSGRFYGPTAQQLGASFSLTNGEGTDFTGSFIGNQSGAATTNVALSNIITTQTFTTDGWRQYPPTYLSPPLAGPQGEEADQLTLPGPGSTGITFTPLSGSGLTAATFEPTDAVASANPNFTQYQTTANGVVTQLALYKAGAGNTELPLTYTGFGSWQQTASGSINQTWFVYGLPTSLTMVLQRTGSATYNGVAYGTALNTATLTSQPVNGSSQFNVNFSAQQISGSVTLGGFGTYALSSTGNFTTRQPSTGVNMNLSQGVGNGGPMTVRFYGPNAEEIAGSFAITDNGSPNYNINGVAAAKR